MYEYWLQRGYPPEKVDQLPFVQAWGFYRIHQYLKLQEIVQFQYPVRAGIASALFGRPPLTLERASGDYSRTYESHQERLLQPFKGFPKDIKFLSADSIRAGQKAGWAVEKVGLPNPWPEDRVQAALNGSLLAKRAAQELELWRWFYAYDSRGIKVSQDMLYNRAKMLFYIQALEPDPLIKDQALRAGKDPKEVWYKRIERQQPGIVKRLEQALEETMIRAVQFKLELKPKT
jgi:hypothetical protein